MPVRLHLDSRGGAIVELAISTVLLVPLILYSTWFADVGHWKLKLEEATIGTTMDLTAWKVNDFSRADPNFDGYYRNAIRGVTDGATSMKRRMATSLDSAMPNRHTFESAVFVRPQALQVDCYDFPGGKPNTMTVNFTQNEGRAGQDVPELNKNTWVTCNSRARIHTAGMPQKYKEMNSASTLFASSWSTFELCGVGPGVQGCGTARSAGLSIMLDDWGLWDVSAYEDAQVPMTLTKWNRDLPDPAYTCLDHGGGPHINSDYFKMAKRYWRTPPGAETSPSLIDDVMAIAGVAGDLGLTDYFHLSYRYGPKHRYGEEGATTATERCYGQIGAFGGPDAAGSHFTPHTGGPWHEHHAFPGPKGVSEQAWEQRFPNASRYMGVDDWPVDRE
jgi:hypothetical protein